MNDEDDELMDMWLLGMFDGGNKGGGCLGCTLFMIAVPVIMLVGLVSMI